MFKTRFFSNISRPVLILGVLLTPVFAAPPVTYLALGDSVSFGMDPNLLPTAAGQPLPSPSKFVGYPEIIAGVDVRFHNEINASCPGETADSFISGTAPDNGCHGIGPTGQGPFKPTIGLKVDYTGSQLAFAVSKLAATPSIKLVTLSIGANDVLIVLANCTIAGGDVVGCINTQLPIALQKYGQDLAIILTAIRQNGNYAGTITLLKYYSPSPAVNDVTVLLNNVMAQVGKAFGARMADGYGSFQLASTFSGGDACKAGLLIINKTNGSCDQHPSPAGRNVLAAAVELALPAIK